MDFSLTPEQEMLQNAVREFAEKELLPIAAKIDESHAIPQNVLKKMAELNLYGITIPRQYDGVEMGHVAKVIALMELGGACASTGFLLQVNYLGLHCIQEFGTEEQKKKYLPPLAKGEKLAAFAVTEPSGGSDVLGLQTTAQLDGDNYILNGRKCYITNSGLANTFTVVARTGKEAKDLSAFVVEKGAPGFIIGRRENKIGLRGLFTGELVFDKCKVPKANLLGEENSGLKYALSAIGEVGRLGNAAVSAGIVQSCKREAKSYANQRILYGKPIASLQAIQLKMAKIALEADISKMLVYRAAWLKDQSERCDNEVAMAKYYATKAAARNAQRLIDITGAMGGMMEHPAQRHLRDAENLLPAAGTPEIMQLIIARNAFK